MALHAVEHSVSVNVITVCSCCLSLARTIAPTGTVCKIKDFINKRYLFLVFHTLMLSVLLVIGCLFSLIFVLVIVSLHNISLSLSLSHTPVCTLAQIQYFH